MNFSMKKFWNDYGVIGVLLTLVVVYVLYMFYNYFTGKGVMDLEKMEGEMKQREYANEVRGPQPAEESGNEVFADVNGGSMYNQSFSDMNPSDLLPKDTNSEWASLNPVGKGELSNINLLKSGYNIGIDTVGTTLRNANLQIRSEPPNPQLNVGPWNQSTIEPDLMRPPLEIGSGAM
jgi:hypothetical protein